MTATTPHPPADPPAGPPAAGENLRAGLGAGLAAGLRVLVLASLGAIAACQTTGDPREGGLFGWNEDKARERQQALSQQEGDAQRRAEAEKARSGQLQGRQSGLQAESARLQADIDRLLAENTQLERELRELIAKRQLGGDELGRLQQLLAANARARKAALPAPGQTAPRPAALVSAQSDAVNQQNQRLQREVMILLQR